MTRYHAWLMAFGLLALPGCMGSVRNPASRAAVQREADGEPDTGVSKHMTIAYDLDGEAPLPELAVKSAVIKASDIWREKRAELAAQREQLAAADFRRFVERESALLINDRLSETLLHEQATLRMPEEAGPRIDGFVDAEIRRIVSTEHDGIQRRYERALRDEGLTLNQARAALRRKLVIQAYLEQELRNRIGEPTRRELVETFERTRESLRRPPQRKMSLIDLRLNNYLPEDVTEPTRDQMESARSQARSTALELIDALDRGEPFDELARTHSHGLHAEEGGAWGWVLPGTVRERFAPAVEALYHLEPGGIAGPVETPDSFFIVCCDESDPGFEPDFETMQPQLQEAYGRHAYNELVTEHIAELRRKSGLELATLERFHLAVVQSALSVMPSAD